MVIRSEEWDMLLLWESTTLSKLKDVQSGIAHQGVQLVPLSEKIRTYNGDVGIKQLEGITVDGERKKKLMAFRQEVKGRPYEQNKLELFKSAYDGPFGHNEEDLSSIFCSELFAEGYQRMEFLTEDTPSNEYTPGNLSHLTYLESGGRLKNIIEIEV